MKSERNGFSKAYYQLEAKNYYQRLNLDTKASLADIKKSYHKLAAIYHPDKNDSPCAGYEFGLIDDAYKTLCHPNLKIEYDNLLKNNLGSIPSQAKSKNKGSFQYKFKSNDYSKTVHSMTVSNNYTAIAICGEGIHIYSNQAETYLKTIKVE